jgi:hypothetical protein
VAAALGLLAPELASAGHGDSWPASDYARAGDCGGTIKSPVEISLKRFPSSGNAKLAIALQTGWDSQDPGSPGWFVKMQDSPASGANTPCESEGSGRVTTSASGDRRTTMRLWANTTSGAVAGTPMRQHRVDTVNGCSWATNAGSSPGGFTGGRLDFERAFEGVDAPYGPYPMTESNWGNSASVDTCDGHTATGDGLVAVFQPRDDFGYNDNWQNFTTNSDPTKDPFQLALNDGVTAVRYAVNWGTVGIGGSSLSGSCSQRTGAWGPDDRAYKALTGLDACTTPPANYIAPIEPILKVIGAPSPYGRWLCSSPSTQTCNGSAGTCTATSDPDPNNPTAPAVVDNAAANSDWKAFVENVAERYPLAKAIEVWNEPNLTNHFWGGCDPNPQRYADLLHQAHDGVKASSNPGTTIALGSMSPVEDGSNADWLVYLRNVATDSGTSFANWFDVMGIHAYRTVQDAAPSSDYPDGQSFSQAAEVDVELARQFLDDHAAGNEPVWVTEVGVSTGLGPNSPKYVSSEAQQATVLQSIYQGLRVDESVPVVMIHSFIDSAPNSGGDAPGYGVITNPSATNPWRQKPAYSCLALTRGKNGSCP